MEETDLVVHRETRREKKIMTMKRRRTKSTILEDEESMEKKQKSRSSAAQTVKTVPVEDESMDRWLELPTDVLELIMKRLFYVDGINFRAVCKSWNSIYRGTVVKPLVKQLPWLVVLDETSAPSLNKTSYSCRLVDPAYKKTYRVDMSNITDTFSIGKVYNYSKYGWLLISSNENRLFAYTPFTSVNNFIELPTLESRMMIIKFATFASNPSTDQNCLFIVIGRHKFTISPINSTTYFSNTFKIMTCRRGEQSWSSRYLKYRGPEFVMGMSVDVLGRWIYSEGNIYYVVGLGGLRPPSGVVKLVKWEVMESHDEVLYASFMKLDKEDDDSKYLLSKLRKDYSSVHYDIYGMGRKEKENVYGSWDRMEGRTRLKIHPPHH